MSDPPWDAARPTGHVTGNRGTIDDALTRDEEEPEVVLHDDPPLDDEPAETEGDTRS